MNRRDSKKLRNVLLALYLVPLILFLALAVRLAKDALIDREAMAVQARDEIQPLSRCRRALDSAFAESLPTLRTERLLEFRRAADAISGTPVLQNAAQFALEASMGLPSYVRERKSESMEAVLTHRLADAARVLSDMEEDARKTQEENEESFAAAFRSLLLLFGSFLIFTIVYALAAVAMLVGNQARSLNELSRGTRALRNGDLDFRFHRITTDECGLVMNDFNEMARKLKAQSAGLENAVLRLREHAERLIEARQHKDRFLANMSHELRTPLNAIIGFSELLEQRAATATPERIRQNADRILKAAEHLLALITSILDLAKSDAGVLKPVFCRFNLSAAIADSVELLRPLAERKNLRVEADLEADLMVEADQRMMRQIFFNLFSNAVKFADQGVVSVSLAKKDGSAVLSVADSGIGIKDEEKKNIFKDFYRIDNGPEHLTDGTGIGLALSRRLAALNRGSISFESEYGVGSTFSVAIPLPERKDAADAGGPPSRFQA